MKKLIVILIIGFSTLSAESVYNVRVNNSSFKINALKHYNNDLISVNQISNYVLPNSKLLKNSNAIESNDFTITYTPGTIYIVKENWLGKRVAQLDLPVLQLKKNIYFPLKSFLLSLDTLDIYNVLEGDDGFHFLLTDNNFSGLANLNIKSEDLIIESKNTIRQSDKFFISDGDNKKIRINKAEPFKNSFDEITKKLGGAIKLLEPEEYKAKIKIENPTKLPPIEQNPEFIIPEGLIRKELEEIKQNPK